MFDKSLNSVLQIEQMDIEIRCWSDEDCKVQTEYYDSKCLERTNSDTICVTFCNLVAFVQFKKREKHPWWSVNFSKVAQRTTICDVMHFYKR